jgi:RNA polymerase sigma-70 factor (ECF subfamily)
VADLGDSSLLRRFLDGDPEAVSRVAIIARFVVGDRAYVIPEADRQDLVQECLVHVYRACRNTGFRLEQSLQAFVRTVAYRRCVDWMRRQHRAVPVDPAIADPSEGPEAQLAERETIEQGRQVLQALGENCREVIRMRAIEGLSYRRVAERLGKSEGAARNIMYRCLQEARAILEALESRIRRGRQEGRE